MIWFLVSQMFSRFLTWLRLGRTSEADKDLEILILRQQLGSLQHKPLKPNRTKISLVRIAAKTFPSGPTILHDGLAPDQPEPNNSWQALALAAVLATLFIRPKIRPKSCQIRYLQLPFDSILNLPVLAA